MHKMKWRYTYVSTCLSCIYYGHSSSQQNHILIDQYILLDHRDQLKLTNCPNRKKIPQHIYLPIYLCIVPIFYDKDILYNGSQGEGLATDAIC